MPIYEYRCECGRGEDKLLPLSERDEPQVCSCGKTMQRLMSVASFVTKPTGKGMALDTLNSNVLTGRHKAGAEQVAARGL